MKHHSLRAVPKLPKERAVCGGRVLGGKNPASARWFEGRFWFVICLVRGGPMGADIDEQSVL